MSVDRCVCHGVRFEMLTPIIESLRAQGVEDEDELLARLRERTKCTTGCGMCAPYVRLCVRTGRTRFAPLPPGVRVDPPIARGTPPLGCGPGASRPSSG